jgi:hypothetical protein
MKTSTLLMAALLCAGIGQAAAAEQGHSLLVYNAGDNLLSTHTTASRITFADGNMVVSDASGAVLATHALADVDYFALADNGIHNTASALTQTAAAPIRINATTAGLVVTAPEAIQSVTVYGIDGRQLAHVAATGSTAEVSVDVTGVLLVQVRTAQGVSTVKYIKK